MHQGGRPDGLPADVLGDPPLLVRELAVRLVLPTGETIDPHPILDPAGSWPDRPRGALVAGEDLLLRWSLPVESMRHPGLARLATLTVEYDLADGEHRTTMNPVTVTVGTG